MLTNIKRKYRRYRNCEILTITMYIDSVEFTATIYLTEDIQNANQAT